MLYPAELRELWLILRDRKQLARQPMDVRSRFVRRVLRLAGEMARGRPLSKRFKAVVTTG